MNSLFDESNNKVFVGNVNKLQEWLNESNNETPKVIERTKLLIKNYLELDNVSFLFGAGSSIHLGAVAIRNFPKQIEDALKAQQTSSKIVGLYDAFLETIRKLQNKNDIKDIERTADRDIKCEFEKVLNYLLGLQFLYEEEKREESESRSIDNLIRTIKEALFELCDVRTLKTPDWLVKIKDESKFQHHQHQAALLKGKNKFIFHEKFLKSLLQRQVNLRRANIFTMNYDLAFEYAFDNLGVHYVDGFSGFHKRFFKPEMFNYDFFYPGSTTSGKVERIEKVVKYYKLHGSISWVASEKRDSNNLYGVEELPLELIKNSNKKGEIIIYPSALKKSYTLDLPYSELFRQFAATISQPQSVLFTIGYSFADEHLNDIIFQALSNPSFTLIVVDFIGTKQPTIEKLKHLDDSRIIIMEGDYFGDFLTFAHQIMPDFYDIESNGKIAKTLNEYFINNTTKSILGAAL